MDTMRLEAWIEARIPRPRRTGFWHTVPMRLRAAAAMLLGMALLGVLLWSPSGGPVLASTAEMARFYQEMISGTIPVTQVDSIEQARRVLTGSWPEQPGLPFAADGHVMACCMREIKDRKMVGVLLRTDGGLITLSVARSSDLRSPQKVTAVRAGQPYHVQSIGDLNMVSTQRDGRWICLMGELPAERLIDIAQGLKFD